MANKKISALTSATTPLAGTEVLPIVQSGSTVQVSVSNLTVGRTVTMNALSVDSTTTDTSTFSTNQSYTFNRYTNTGGSARTWYIQTAGNAFNIADQTAGYLNRISIDTSGNVSFSTGNLVQGTAAKGVNFTANTPLAGMTSQLLNWYEEGTWTPAPNSGTFSSATGRYTRIGRQVTLTFDITVGTGGGTTMTAPITSTITTANGIYTSGQTFGVGTTSPTVVIGGSGTTIYFRSVGSAVGFSAMTLTASASISGALTYFA